MVEVRPRSHWGRIILTVLFLGGFALRLGRFFENRPLWTDEAKLGTTVALAQQLIFPALAVGAVALIVSIIGHGHLLGLFRVLLWLWLIGMLGVLFGMTWGAYRKMRRGNLVQYLATAASVPALIVYLALANAGAIIGAAFGRKTEFNRTPKTGA